MKRRGIDFSKFSTRRSDVDCHRDAVCLSLGGVNLYACDAEYLDYVVEAKSAVIEDSLLPHLTMLRNPLAKLVREEVKHPVERRLFTAILGRLLRLGRITCFPCLTINGKVLRTLVHRDQIGTFQEQLEWTVGALRENGVLAVRTVERHCFPEPKWGTWVSSSNLLAHAAYKGYAVYADKDRFTWPGEIENAVRSAID